MTTLSVLVTGVPGTGSDAVKAGTILGDACLVVTRSPAIARRPAMPLVVVSGEIDHTVQLRANDPRAPGRRRHALRRLLSVGDSVRTACYYRNNVVGALSSVLHAMVAERCAISFSSTAAVFGNPVETPITRNSIRAAY